MTVILQTALQLIKSKLFPWIMLALFGVVIYFLSISNNSLKEDNRRISANFSEAQKKNTTFNLTKDEFQELLKNSEEKTAKHIDSLLKANKIKVNQVSEVHNITNNYKDTSIVVLPVPKDTVKPFEINNDCMVIRGEISHDQLRVNERVYSNEIDVISYLVPRKLWFIRVGWKGENIKAFSKCGEVAIKSYKKVKQ